jgi:hypothetical protein
LTSDHLDPPPSQPDVAARCIAASPSQTILLCNNLTSLWGNAASAGIAVFELKPTTLANPVQRSEWRVPFLEGPRQR